MKKMIFGALLTIVGLTFAVLCFVYASMNPWDYNGIDGLFGSLLGTHTFVPFLASIGVVTTGIVICGTEAYGKSRHLGVGLAGVGFTLSAGFLIYAGSSVSSTTGYPGCWLAFWGQGCSFLSLRVFL